MVVSYEFTMMICAVYTFPAVNIKLMQTLYYLSNNIYKL